MRMKEPQVVDPYTRVTPEFLKDVAGARTFARDQYNVNVSSFHVYFQNKLKQFTNKLNRGDYYSNCYPFKNLHIFPIHKQIAANKLRTDYS